MALTVDEIAEILNTMRVENEHNVENFEKVLTGINAKLEIMSEDNEATDLIKLYISELKKAVDDKHNLIIKRFGAVDSSMQNLLESQNAIAKTDELKDLFQVLSLSFDNFSGEIASQKNILNNLEENLSKLNSNTFNKDELAGIINDVSVNLSDVSRQIDKTFSAFENSLNNAVSSINGLSTFEQVDQIKNKVDAISEDINSIPSKISFASLEDKIAYFQTLIDSIKSVVIETSSQSSDVISEKFKSFESSLENIVTDSDFAGFKSDLADFVQKIIDNSSALNNSLSYSTERIESILATINSLDFRDDFAQINEKFSELRNLISSIDKTQNEKLNNWEEKLSTVLSEEDFQEFKNEISNYVQDLINDSSLIKSDLKHNKDQIDSILKSIEKLDYQIDLETIQNRIAELENLLKAFSQSNSYNFQNLEKTLASIVTDSDFAGFKADLADFVQKIIDNSSTLNSNLSYSTERIENILSTINSLDYKNDFENIVEKVAELKNIVSEENGSNISFRSEMSENLGKIIGQISGLEKTLSEVKTEEELVSFRENLTELVTQVQSNTNSLNTDLSYGIQRLENIFDAVNSISFKDDITAFEEKIEELKDLVNLVSSDNSAEFENLQKSLSTIVTDSDFAGFKSDLADFVQKIIDNSSALNKELEYTAERIENILTTIKSIDFREDFENIVLKINELKETFEDGSKVNYTNLSLELSDLSEKLDTSFANLDEKRQNIYGDLKSELANILLNIHNLMEANPQKSIDELSISLSQISEKIALIRNGISSDLQEDYGDIKVSVNSVISNLQSAKDEILSSNIANNNKQDENFASIISKIDSQISIFAELKDVLAENNKTEASNIISAIDKLNIDVTDIVSGINENENSNYEAIKEYIEELSSNLNNLNAELDNITKQNSTNLISEINVVSDNINSLKEEFRQAVESNLNNSSKIVDGMSVISERIDSVQDVLSANSTNNFEAIQASFEDLSKRFTESINNQQEAFAQLNELSEQKKLEVLNNLSTDVKSVQDWLNSNNESFKSVVKNNILEIKEFIGEVNNSLYESQVVSENKLSSKLEALEVLYQNFEASVSDVNSGIKNILENINHLDATEQNEVVKQELENVKTNINSVLENLNKIEDKNNEFTSILLSLSEIVLKKDDINNLENKFNEFSELLVSVKDIIKNSEDENLAEFSKLCEKFDVSFAGVLSENTFENYKKELIDLIQKIIDNSEIVNTYSLSNQSKLIEILERISKFEPVNYSYDLEQISLKVDNLCEICEANSESNFGKLSEKIDAVKEEISKNNISELVNSKFEDFAVILSSVKDLVSNSSEFNSNLIEDKFAGFKESFSKIVTEEDFTNFRADFSDFIQKILDNVTVAHLNSDTNKEKLFEVAEQIKALDYATDFKNILERLDEVKEDFKINSKMNYDNIIGAVNSFKEEFNNNVLSSIDDRNEKYNNINNELSNILLNVQLLKDFTSEKSTEIFENISTDLHSSLDELKENIALGTKIDIESVKNLINDVNAKLNDFSTDFVQKYDANSFSMSSGFDNVKISLENLIDAFTNFRDLVKDDFSANVNTLLPNLNEITIKVDDLINEIKRMSSEYSVKILDSINDVSSKFDNLSDSISSEINENMSAFKDILTSLSDNFQMLHSEISQQLKDNNETQLIELKNISLNISDFKSHVNEAAEGLRDYISELNLAAKSSKSLSDSKFSEKLLDLEAALIHSSEIHEQKLELLQGKLSEFAQIIEGSASDTEAKIASSVEEITDVKTELSLLNDSLKSIKLSSDEKFTETVASIETGISSIISNLDSVSDSLSEGFNEKLNENVLHLDEKFDGLLTSINDIASNSLSNDLEEKLSGLKQEIGLINTDIANALQENADNIENSINGLKSDIQEFTAYDFDNIVNEIKAQLELSFMNFSVDINGELSSTGESVSRLEQAYKETFNKISLIEDCVSEKIQNDIELLNLIIEQNSRDIKNTFGDKLDNYIDELKSHLDLLLNNTKTYEKIDNLKDELSIKLDAVLDEQNNLSESAKTLIDNNAELNQKLDALVESSDTEEILDSLTEIELKAQERGADLKDIINSLTSKVDVIANDSSLKLALSTIGEKIDSIADNNTIEQALKMLSEKIDILIADNSINSLSDKVKENFELINNKIDVIASDTAITEFQEKFDDAFEGINTKIDILASDSSLEELQEKFDEISETEEKVAEMLSALHEKVDVLAMDGSDFDLEEEIDDIKDLIFEQRKYFEATSDEKAAAIDKYLKDVLLKLDNVDLEKNSEDIKESIMNALVSLFDQISFVEETEDIKDFVEEKTDEINQNLIEVQNQLKQIASSNDDFDYSYTLQDVETDIAKLRLAINNMSGSDFESLSDNIKKIVKSVEGLESSLTQDQVVDLKSDIEKLNEDILSISSRTNKILLSSDESYKALNEGLNNFSSLVYKLEDRINYLDNNAVSERLEKKIDNIQSMSIASANADKVFHQVMMYLGEWIDSTTENISSITEKTSEIADIKESINELKEAMPEKSSILDELEEKFEQQELRIDRLEMKIEKILSALEQKDDMMLNRKVDKIEKLISRLGTNIEKLASYVDEE